jgi:hypothetical protein
MIKLFRNFNPFTAIWLVILLLILRISYLLRAPDKLQFSLFEPFARLLIPLSYERALSPTDNIWLAAVCILLQALLLNYLVNKYNLFGKPTFLPALTYITITALFTPFLVLSPPLICNFLLIWMFFKLFNFYKSPDAKSNAYDLGMMVAIGTLIYFPFIYFTLAVFAALILFRPFNWREWVAVLLGFVTIFFFLAVFYYLNDKIILFYNIWLPLGSRFPAIQITYINYLVLIPVLLILVLSLFTLQKNFFKSYVQIRKSFQLLFFSFVVATLSFYVKSDFLLSHFLLCAIPVSVFSAYYFLHAKRRWFYELLFLILFAGILYFRFNTF